MIDQKQLEVIKNLIINSSLKNGISPTAKFVNDNIDNFFQDKELGLPYFKPILVKKYECSDPKKYNEMFSNLEKDLNIIYENNLDANNKIVSLLEYYSNEKEKLDGEIEKLNIRLDTLQESLISNKPSEIFIENFKDFYNIDFIGDKNRNIYKTDAFVDLLQRKVYCEKTSKANDKINISKATISINNINITNDKYDIGDLNNILMDTMHKTYTMVYSQSQDTYFKSELLVTLEKEIEISSILLNIKTTNAVNIILFISNDGNNFKEQMDIDTTAFTEWNFSKQKIKSFKFIIKKYEPDAYNGVDYEYYFSFINISCINEKYINKNVLTTKPININKIPETIKVNFNDIIYPNNDIKYYIGIDNNVDKIDWKLLNNNIDIDLGLLDKVSTSISQETSSYELIDNKYKIYTCKDNYNVNTFELFIGYHQWYVEKFNIPIDVVNDNFIIDINHGTQERLISSEFIDNEVYNYNIQTNNMIVYTQYIYCDNDYNMPNKFINGDIQHAIYLNNVNLQKVNNKYNLNFIKGLNKIQICVFSLQDQTIYHNINTKIITFNVYANKMIQKTIHNLYNNTQPNDVNYYSIDEENNIIVNFNPSNIKFYLNYKYISDDSLIKYPNKNINIRLMCILNSYINDLSPQIIDYKVISN